VGIRPREATVSRWTMADVRAHKARHGESAIGPEPKQREKFGNQKVLIDGILFDSKKEGAHYLLLKMRERLKEIDGLELQPVFPIYIDTPDRGRIHCGDFTADFRYWEHYCGKDVLRVIDVKSPASKTEAYQLRKKLVEAIYNIEIIEP
jgi:Protein of unknown function (DUF1064)